MSGLLCVAGALVLLAGVVVASATHSVRDGMYVQAAGATVLGIAGGLVLWSGDAVGSSFVGGFHPELGVDRLSGVFLLTLGIASGPALVFAAGYLDASARGRAVAGLTGLFVGVMALMLCARDVVTFLAAWELMTVVPAAIILVWRNEEQARRGVFVYVGDHAPCGRRGVGCPARPGRPRRARRCTRSLPLRPAACSWLLPR